MNIKNLNIFKNPKVKTRLCALSLTGVVLISALSGCDDKNDYGPYSREQFRVSSDDYNQISKDEMYKTFDVGQHIVSIPVEDPTKKAQQYSYYKGYKCIGLATTAYGKYSDNFGGACVLYVNEYPVECSATDKDQDGVVVFGSPGIPIGYEEEKNEKATHNIGEHIISVPIGDPRGVTVQYEYHEGYEIVDIALSSYGKYSNNFSGGAIMYVNTVPVTCIYDENRATNGYVTFGTPVELEEVKTKSLD